MLIVRGFAVTVLSRYILRSKILESKIVDEGWKGVERCFNFLVQYEINKMIK